MQKEIFIVSFILVVMFGLSFTTQSYSREQIDSVGSQLREIYDLANESLNMSNESGISSKDDIENKMENVNSIWNTANKKLAYYTEHDELEKISTSMVTIKEYVLLENYEDAIPEIQKCIFILEHLEEKGTFSIVNLF